MNQQIIDRRYKIVRVLSDDGGFGRTYLAQDTKRPGNPICVVKQLKSQAPDVFAIAKDLFIKEAEKLEELGEHSQIPRLLAYFDEREEFYLVQEYIQGETLESIIENKGKLSEQEVIILLKELLNVIQFVHNKGVIHRDIKPANIMIITKDNKPVLIDFGAVKESSTLGTSQATIIGTPGYSPEEQFRGEPHFCSDIYALGVTCIQALTGLHPNTDSLQDSLKFDDDNEIIWQNKVNISSDLAKILTKMVRYQSRDRYQTVKDILNKPLFTPSISWWQKYKLQLIFSGLVTIAVGGIFLIPPRRPYVPRLSLNGKTITGKLTKNSEVEPLKNIYSAAYIFEGQKDKQITIELNSSQFDPSLTILKPNRQYLATNDDISPDNFNSKIVITLPEDGIYQATVKASQSGEIGEYQLKALVE